MFSQFHQDSAPAPRPPDPTLPKDPAPLSLWLLGLLTFLAASQLTVSAFIPMDEYDTWFGSFRFSIGPVILALALVAGVSARWSDRLVVAGAIIAVQIVPKIDAALLWDLGYYTEQHPYFWFEKGPDGDLWVLALVTLVLLSLRGLLRPLNAPTLGLVLCVIATICIHVRVAVLPWDLYLKPFIFGHILMLVAIIGVPAPALRSGLLVAMTGTVLSLVSWWITGPDAVLAAILGGPTLGPVRIDFQGWEGVAIFTMGAAVFAVGLIRDSIKNGVSGPLFAVLGCAFVLVLKVWPNWPGHHYGFDNLFEPLGDAFTAWYRELGATGSPFYIQQRGVAPEAMLVFSNRLPFGQPGYIALLGLSGLMIGLGAPRRWPIYLAGLGLLMLLNHLVLTPWKRGEHLVWSEVQFLETPSLLVTLAIAAWLGAFLVKSGRFAIVRSPRPDTPR